ncbi:MAG: uracil phosphoribosyltransferase [Fimbriimonadales bacterium]|jgi:uracil phosphoribosyltransferase|nr:uracil phosphoribosyltransferase [Armatimonadota bacterium]MCX7688553.1 uracil phosphoribosyltransferase [Fimbriimonadales bacterium]CUU06254.1 uracil phosphoribosyltransferase [Armatimonadetes bacterium GBS]CUU35862.1 uracil phosphoribosyltransferase [Armatimonadetes bacterium GXS]CUU36569.1 uracil phosphoribosyltransferase [Armatimonadetes bacterium DC]GBC91409.1 Uracil phosphoribosyltransferase [bacterium HR14]
MQIEIVSHPLVKHILTQLRDERTEPARFRALARQLTFLLAIEATRDLPVRTHPVKTPLETTEGYSLAKAIVAVPILRAGLGMLEALTELFPDLRVGYIGLERDEQTAIARAYYCKLPPLDNSRVLLLDPMLATGGSAAQAVEVLVNAGAEEIVHICVVAAPEGVRLLNEKFPQVRIVAASLDRGLNERKFILPGLGDFGDRLYGTGAR